MKVTAPAVGLIVTPAGVGSVVPVRRLSVRVAVSSDSSSASPVGLIRRPVFDTWLGDRPPLRQPPLVMAHGESASSTRRKSVA